MEEGGITKGTIIKSNLHSVAAQAPAAGFTNSAIELSLEHFSLSKRYHKMVTMKGDGKLKAKEFMLSILPASWFYCPRKHGEKKQVEQKESHTCKSYNVILYHVVFEYNISFS